MDKTLKIPITVHTKLRIFISKRGIDILGEGISQALEMAIDYEKMRDCKK